MSGTITMALDEYQALVKKNEVAYNEVAALRAQLDKQIEADPFWASTKDAMQLVRFMMAHLAPESTHGWPVGALERYATYLLTVPGLSSDNAEWANDAKSFAHEAIAWDKKREKFWAEQLEKAKKPSTPRDRAVAYLAHPLSGDIKGNIARARRWRQYLIRTTPFVIIAPWIGYVEALDDNIPADREIGMSANAVVLRRCDLLIAVGGRISNGMSEEIQTMQTLGKPTISLINLGEEPPASAIPLDPSIWAGLAKQPESRLSP